MSKRSTSKAAPKRRASSKKTTTAPKALIDMDQMRSISEFMASHGLTVFEVKTGDTQIHLRRAESPFAGLSAAPVLQAPMTQMASSSEARSVAPAAPETKEVEEERYLVKSPFVGTFYRSAGPNQESFVEEGKIVGAGDTLCIVEAMKLMNEIESDVAGRITRVLVKNSTPVEFGEALFEIAPL